MRRRAVLLSSTFLLAGILPALPARAEASTVPTIAIADATVVEGDAGTVDAIFDVTLSRPGQTASIRYATQYADAGPDDLVAASGTLVVAAGRTSAKIAVRVIGDTSIEPDESFFVDLLDATNARIGDARAVGTIVNDDVAPDLTVDPASALEGNPGSPAALVFAVRLSKPVPYVVGVDAHVEEGTAWENVDYRQEFLFCDATFSVTCTPKPYHVDFAPGETSKQIAIPIVPDSRGEPDETVFLHYTAPRAANPEGVVKGKIVNDDGTPRYPMARAQDSVDNETFHLGERFDVQLEFPVDRTYLVQYETAEGFRTRGNWGFTSSAAAPDDYPTQLGALVFDPSETQKSLTVAINDDDVCEQTELFFVDFKTPPGTLAVDPATTTAFASIFDADGVVDPDGDCG